MLSSFDQIIFLIQKKYNKKVFGTKKTILFFLHLGALSRVLYCLLFLVCSGMRIPFLTERDCNPLSHWQKKVFYYFREGYFCVVSCVSVLFKEIPLDFRSIGCVFLVFTIGLIKLPLQRSIEF